MGIRSDIIPFDGGADIQYTVPDSSPGVSAYKRVDEAGGSRVDISYKLPWDRRFDARDALLGDYSRLGITMVKIPPHALDWDTAPGRRPVYCQSAAQVNQAPIKGKVGDSNADFAIFQCVYSSLHYRPLTDAAALSANPDLPEIARYISFPAPKKKTVTKAVKGGTWIWESDGKDAVEAAHINLSETHYPIKLWFWPRASVPWGFIDELQNKTNAEPLLLGNYVWPAGKVVFTGDPGIEEVDLPDGEPGVHLILWFIIGRFNANDFPRSDKGWAFEALIAKDLSGNRPHPPGDMDLLFTPV